MSDDRQQLQTRVDSSIKSGKALKLVGKHYRIGGIGLRIPSNAQVKITGSRFDSADDISRIGQYYDAKTGDIWLLRPESMCKVPEHD